MQTIDSSNFLNTIDFMIDSFAPLNQALTILDNVSTSNYKYNDLIINIEQNASDEYISSKNPDLLSPSNSNSNNTNFSNNIPNLMPVYNSFSNYNSDMQSMFYNSYDSKNTQTNNNDYMYSHKAFENSNIPSNNTQTAFIPSNKEELSLLQNYNFSDGKSNQYHSSSIDNMYTPSNEVYTTTNDLNKYSLVNSTDTYTSPIKNNNELLSTSNQTNNKNSNSIVVNVNLGGIVNNVSSDTDLDGMIEYLTLNIQQSIENSVEGVYS